MSKIVLDDINGFIMGLLDPSTKRNEFLIRHYSPDGKDNVTVLGKNWIKGYDDECSKTATFICDGVSSLDIIENVSSSGYATTLVIGPGLSHKSRDRLINMKTAYDDKLSIFSMSKRPEYHGFAINNNILLEDKHSYGKDYKMALIIENPRQYEFNYFLDCVRAEMAGSREIGISQLDKFHPYN